METWDSGTLSNVKKIPLLTVRRRDETGWLVTLPCLPLGGLQVRAGPRDGEAWNQRLKEEYQALIKYVQARRATLRCQGFAARRVHAAAAQRSPELAASARPLRLPACLVALRARCTALCSSLASRLTLRHGSAVEQGERQRLVHHRLRQDRDQVDGEVLVRVLRRVKTLHALTVGPGMCTTC